MKSYTLSEFQELSHNSHTKESEKIFLIEIIRALQDMGGSASRSEIFNWIKQNSQVIPSEYMDLSRQGKGGTWYPYTFNYQFAKLNGNVLGLVKYSRKKIELTKEGFDFNPDKNNLDGDWQKVDKYWKEKNKNKKSTSKNVDEEIKELTPEIEEQWRADLRQKLHEMSPRKFERFARRLVKEMGVTIDEVKGVQVSNDGGIDGFGYITKDDDFRTSRVAIQAKRWQGNVGRVDVQNFIGAMSTNSNQAEYGIFIATSDFNKNAMETARDSVKPVTLVNGDKICDLVENYQIGISPVIAYEFDESLYSKD